MQIYDNTKFHILQYGVLHKLFPSNLYNLIFHPPRLSGPSAASPAGTPCAARPRDHPRVCGEKPHGSSGFFRRWDHPRVCGEKSRCGTFALQIPGSPPRVRGKAFRDRQVNGFDGITPAYAGKRLLHTSGDIRGWDHPRVCGEKSAASIWAICARGSPPRVRGKAGRALEGACIPGITPACAGKSLSMQLVLALSGDHPRVCGEKYPVMDDAFIDMGSPPRMRGKEKKQAGRAVCGGITPACAGKSCTEGHSRPVRRDHPRVCGEKNCGSKLAFRTMGSPPRMRGKGLLEVFVPEPLRITPAYAGKSVIRISDGCLRRDHPRVCGEKGCCKFSSLNHSGSPPRVRGKAVPLRSAAASGCRGPSVPEYDAPP